MKKSFFALLSLILIFALLFISCDKPEDNADEETTASHVNVSDESGITLITNITADDVAPNTYISEWLQNRMSYEPAQTNYVLTSLMPNGDCICYVYRPAYAQYGINPVLETTEDSITAVINYENGGNAADTNFFCIQFPTGDYSTFTIDFKDPDGNQLTSILNAPKGDIAISTWKK